MIALQLRLSRLCLLFFIVLSGVFTCDNAFSRRDWQKGNLVMGYDKNDDSITFECLIYDYLFSLNKSGYLNWGELAYSEDGSTFTYLMYAAVKYHNGIDRIQIILKHKKKDEHIQIIDRDLHGASKYWPEGKDFVVDGNFINSRYYNGIDWIRNRRSYMTVKWFLPPTCKGIKLIRLKGVWRVDGEQREVINDVYTFMVGKSKSTVINGPLVLKPVISNEVKVSKDADAIIVSGAEPGENIKGYTVLGAEVKSAVANDDGVSIKLPKNHIYIVNTGQASYKVALCVP